MPPAGNLVVSLAATFGTGDMIGVAYQERKETWQTYHGLRGQAAVAGRRLWSRVQPVLLEKLMPGMSHNDKEAEADAHEVAKLLGLKYTDFVANAAKALPEPKSWAARRKKTPAPKKKKTAKPKT